MRAEPVRIGLFGAPGAGKTTVVEGLACRLRAAGVAVGGFVTRELRDGDRRYGFACRDIAGGRTAVIAHTGWDAGPRVGRYRVDVAAFESVALAALETATGEGVVVVDEVGSMELLSPAFVRSLWRLLERPQPVVVTMHSRAHPVTDALRRRDDMELVEVTPANRESLPERLYQRLCGAGPDGPAG
jgi:nucleoside-triphosphatase